MSDWQPISTAPKDGRPVWAKGANYGNPTKGVHYAWAFWLEDHWASPLERDGHGKLTYLTHWLPLPEPPKD